MRDSKISVLYLLRLALKKRDVPLFLETLAYYYKAGDEGTKDMILDIVMKNAEEIIELSDMMERFCISEEFKKNLRGNNG